MTTSLQKRPQEVQTCSTLDTISARWDWNRWTADQVAEFDNLGGNNKAAFFLRLKSLIRTCQGLIGVEF